MKSASLGQVRNPPYTATVLGHFNAQVTDARNAITTYTYDAAGNTLTYANTIATYNNRGRMKTLKVGTTTATYVYNALGQRIKRSGGTPGTVLYVYDEAGHLIGEYTGTGALTQETIWLGDIPVATLRPKTGGVDIFYGHTDHLNTPRKITRPSDNKLRWQWEPDPFGTNLPNENPQALGIFKYHLRFPGQLYDAHAGLNYNYFRDYDPAIGRYVQSDPIGLLGGVNTYAYVLNNPLHYTDPTGLAVGDWWDFPANLERARQIAVEEITRRPRSHNDLGDAMRHAEWMRRTTQETNSCTAWIAGTGHELEGALLGQPLNEMLMDLRNNSVGRDAGRNSTPVDSDRLWILPLNGSPYNLYQGAR